MNTNLDLCHPKLEGRAARRHRVYVLIGTNRIEVTRSRAVLHTVLIRLCLPADHWTNAVDSRCCPVLIL